ncbi:MAG: STAS domain-containing protein [Acidimicrobiales bacterium]
MTAPLSGPAPQVPHRTDDLSGAGQDYLEWNQSFDELSGQFHGLLAAQRSRSGLLDRESARQQQIRPELLSIEIRDKGIMVELRVIGEIDVSTTGYLRSVLDRQVDLPDNPLVVLDLAGVTFIDSSGLNDIVSASRRMRAVGSDLVLQHPRPAVTQVLATTGIDRILTMAEDPE